LYQRLAQEKEGVSKRGGPVPFHTWPKKEFFLQRPLRPSFAAFPWANRPSWRSLLWLPTSLGSWTCRLSDQSGQAIFWPRVVMSVYRPYLPRQFHDFRKHLGAEVEISAETH
jgi:hypothetical protein